MAISSTRSAASRWFWALTAGIILLVAGMVAIFHPFVTTLATALLLGWVLIAAGAFAIVAGSSDLRARGGWLYVLLGALGIHAGLVLIF